MGTTQVALVDLADCTWDCYEEMERADAAAAAAFSFVDWLGMCDLPSGKLT